jgi:hypothetical protein
VLLLYASAAVLAGSALAAHNLRFAAYPEVAAAMILPIALSMISRSTMSQSLQSASRLATILAFIGAPAAYTMLATPAPAETAARTPSATCGIDGAATLLRAYPGQVVLAGVNDTPDLLYRTRVLTVGSLYHRSPANFMRLRAAWRSLPGSAPSAAFQDTHARLVLACPGAPRSALLDGLPPTTLLDQIDADKPPPWLDLVGTAKGFKLYAVKQSLPDKRTDDHPGR